MGDSVRTKDILLSRSLADRLLLGVGDKVEMLFVEPGEMPRRDRFKVAGVYASGMEEMDGMVVVTDIRNVQRLSDWGPDEISGYEIRDPRPARRRGLCPHARADAALRRRGGDREPRGDECHGALCQHFRLAEGP